MNPRVAWVGRDLCHGQGTLPLDQLEQSSILPGLKHFQGWDTHSFPGLLVPVAHSALKKSRVVHIPTEK